MYPHYNFPPNGNFNPNFNRAPFDIPKMRSPIGSVKKAGLFSSAKKMNLSGMINTTSKTINTFNQMVPLYREIKPVFENGKVLMNTFKRAFVKKKQPAVKETKNEVIEPEILKASSVKVKTKTAEPVKEKPQPDEGPHKPFF